jgi:DNA-binding MarR family transcriptional regulator
MASANISDNLYWQLLRVAISAKHNLLSVAEKYGLTVMQLYTLCLIDADNSFPMNSLSSRLHCDASNVTGIVDRLLHQDYIKREENPKDRREKMITLTSKGAALCENISKSLAIFQPETLKALTSEEKKQLKKLLTKIIATSNQ